MNKMQNYQTPDTESTQSIYSGLICDSKIDVEQGDSDNSESWVTF